MDTTDQRIRTRFGGGSAGFLRSSIALMKVSMWIPAMLSL